MADESKMAKAKGDYTVGFGRPPKAHQFRPGQSGNPRGRPPKAKFAPSKVEAILSEPVTVRQDGAARQMAPFEVGLRKLVKRALSGNLSAALELLSLFERHGALKPSEAVVIGGGVLRIPRDWDPDDWKAMLAKHGPPPWPGKRSGLPDKQES